MITIEQIKELRNKTGISIGQCKGALEEAGGDMEKAIVVLSKKGGDIAAKKSGRTLKSGLIETYVHNGKVGAIVELLCETDFVAKNEDFKKLAYDIAMQIAATNPSFLKKEDVSVEDEKKAREVFSEEVKDKPEEMKVKILEGKLKAYFKDRILLEQDFIKNPEVSLISLIENGIQKFGERIEIGRFARFEI